MLFSAFKCLNANDIRGKMNEWAQQFCYITTDSQKPRIKPEIRIVIGDSLANQRCSTSALGSGSAKEMVYSLHLCVYDECLIMVKRYHIYFLHTA